MSSTRQLKRQESASRSFIFSHFNETLAGLSTIRAFSAQTRFVAKMQEKIDDNLIFTFPEVYSSRWISLRLEFIGSLVTLFAGLFAVYGRDKLDSGAAGLSISYSITVNKFIIFSKIHKCY